MPICPITRLEYDPVEDTIEYKKAMEKIQKILDKEFPKDNYYIGMCHQIWRRKKELLAKEGIIWKSPKEMNPNCIFD